MSAWQDRWQQLSGKTRFGVCRIFIHLAGREVAPLLGVLNAAAREAVAADGELPVLGQGLVEICQSLLQFQTHWLAAANEGDVFWDEGEAGDFITELFTDSAQRYLSAPGGEDPDLAVDPLTLPVTHNLIVMISVAFEGEAPRLETDLASVQALSGGLKELISLQDQDRLRAIQVHFSPARLGDELDSDHLIEFFPELIPL